MSFFTVPGLRTIVRAAARSPSGSPGLFSAAGFAYSGAVSRLVLTASSLLCCLTLLACNGGEPAAKAGAGAKADAKAQPDAKPDNAKAEPASDTAATDAAAASAASAEAGDDGGTDTGTETGESDAAPLPESFEQIGVEACDQYVADYVACIDAKAPEDQREAQRREVFKNLEAWKQTKASGPSAAAGLQIGCRSAREQAKRETQAWGCEW